jgi:hypothetical protein
MLLWFGVALAASARTSQAQDCPGVAIGAQGTTTATAGPPMTDGPHGGHPATSSASSGASVPGFNVSAYGSLAVDNGYFESSTHAGGDLDITCCVSESAIVRNKGDVTDCLLMGGYNGGGGYLHIPVHVTGTAVAEWSTTSDYQPSPGAKFAGNQFGVSCYVVVGTKAFACTGGFLEADQDQSVDQIIELVFPFTFGASTMFEYVPTANSSLGYAANGSSGKLSATGNLFVQAVLEAAYAVDGSGTPLPNTTIAASSGFDYFHPVPEASPSALAWAALASLAALRFRPSRS